MACNVSRPLVVFLFTLAILAKAGFLHAVEFSGNAVTDFRPESCIDDPGGRDIAFPPSFSPWTTSGFDIDKVCLVYDSYGDVLYAGFSTFDHAVTGVPIQFGDADGDGNPGSAGPSLIAEEGTDWPDLATEEYFALLFDFDGNSSTSPEVIAGVSAERNITTGFRVSEVALPPLGINFSFLSAYYGTLLSSGSSSSIFANPSADRPHLEILLDEFSSFTGFSSLDQNNPDEAMAFVFKAGSLGDTVIGDEYIRIAIKLEGFFDDDGDDLPNLYDNDSDNDGIPDIAEMNLDLYDSNNNGLFEPSEILAGGLDSDGDGDFDANDSSFNPPDTDGDGTADYLDEDSDNDSILDLHEARTHTFDANGNLEISPEELATIDIGGNYPRGNGSGALQLAELPDTDGDGIPNFRDTDSDNDGIPDATEAGDSDPSTPPVDTNGDGIPDYLQSPDLVAEGNEGDEDPEGSGEGDPNFGNEDPLDPGIAPPVEGTAVQVQGGGCSLNQKGSAGFPGILFIVFLFVLALFFLRPLKLFFFVICLLLPITTHALNSERLRLHTDNLGLVTLNSPATLEKNTFSLGLSIGFADSPLELGAVGTGATVNKLINYHILMEITGAYGINDWITIGAEIPFFPNLKVTPIGQASSNSTAAFGDIGINAKFHLWDREFSRVEMGFAVLPFLTFPSGSTEKFTGDTTVTGGLSALYDVEYKKNRLAANLGVRFREEENFLNLTVGQEMLFGLGYIRPIWEPYDLHVLTELNGSTVFDNFFSRENQDPLELLFAVRKGFVDGIVRLTTGAGAGLTNGYGTPGWRVFSMLAYTSPAIPKVEKPLVRNVPPASLARVENDRIVILKPIHFETGKWYILEDSGDVLNSIAEILKNKKDIEHVVIEGHTDSRGSKAYNDRLSQKRAEAVKTRLVELGTDPARLSSKGWGESHPIADESTDEGMAKNRRVEFHIVEIRDTAKTRPADFDSPPRHITE